MTQFVGPLIHTPIWKSWTSQWFYNDFGKLTMEHKPHPNRFSARLWQGKCLVFARGVNPFFQQKHVSNLNSRLTLEVWEGFPRFTYMFLTKVDVWICVLIPNQHVRWFCICCEHAARLLIHTVYICTCFHNLDAQWCHSETQRCCLSLQIIGFALFYCYGFETFWNMINMPRTLLFHALSDTWIRCRFPSLQN